MLILIGKRLKNYEKTPCFFEKKADKRFMQKRQFF